MSTESQIGLGDGVEVEVGDHVDEVEVYEVVDLELDLEEGELDLACSLEHRLAEDGGGSSCDVDEFHGQMEQTNSMGQPGCPCFPAVEPPRFPWPMNIP